jgi:ATP-binding cassette, subfamily F, member 3
VLILDDLTVRVAGRLLVDAAAVQIPSRARVGLLGRNGTGKTTLLRVIAGELAAERGSVGLARGARVGRLLQEAPDGPQTLIDTVLAADTERAQLLAEADRATDPIRIAEIGVRLADIGAYGAPARAAAILAGLGFCAAEHQRPCNEFSGGWRMRLALAALLFAEPDLLLLDEPTNYLDLEGTLWLEHYLANYPRTALLVSHDRDLLERSVDHILHLNRGKLTLYRGNYSSFERQLRERETLDVKRTRTLEAERRRLLVFVDRFRAKASKARQAQSRLKLLERMGPPVTTVTQALVPINIPAPTRPLSPPILALDDVAVGYGPGRVILKGLTLRLGCDDRVALLGPNGNGKSTLAKLLAGRLMPLEGRIVRAERLKIAYFAQHQLDELRATESPYDHVRRLMPEASEASVRGRAAAIGFSGEAANIAVGRLSGGEKARLLLGLATLWGPHLVILDEPTNHLDIDSRAALIDAMTAYPGAVVVIAHDRYLLEACVDRLLLVANGTVTPFDGDLDDYRRLVLSRSLGPAARGGAEDEARPSRQALRRAALERRAELAPLKRRIAEADATITRLTKEIASLDTELSRPHLFATNSAQAAAAAKARAVALTALANAEEEWLAASTAYAAATT